MPIYEFVCTNCGHREEQRMKMSESYIDKIECFDCGADSTKVPSLSGFELAGGGWAGSGYSKGD